MSNVNNENDTVYHEEWISAYLDDELTAEQRQVVEARLATDPAARALLEDLQKVRNLIGDLPAWKGPGINTAAVITGADLDEQLDLQDELEQDAGLEDAEDEFEEELEEDWEDDLNREPEPPSPRVQAFENEVPRHMPGWVRPAAMAASVLAMLGIGYFLWRGEPLAMLADSRSSNGVSPNAAPANGLADENAMSDTAAPMEANAGQTPQADAVPPTPFQAGEDLTKIQDDFERRMNSQAMPDLPVPESGDGSLFATEMEQYSQRTGARGAERGGAAGIMELSRSAAAPATEQFKSESLGGLDDASGAGRKMMQPRAMQARSADAPPPEAMGLQAANAGPVSDGIVESATLPERTQMQAGDGAPPAAGGLGGRSLPLNQAARGRNGAEAAVQPNAADVAADNAASADEGIESMGELPAPSIRMNVPPADTAEANNGAIDNSNLPRSPGTAEMAELELSPALGESAPAGVVAESEATLADANENRPSNRVTDFSNRLAIDVLLGTGWQESQVSAALNRVTRLLGRRLETDQKQTVSPNADLAVSSLPVAEFDSAVRNAQQVVTSLKRSANTGWRFRSKVNTDAGNGEAANGESGNAVNRSDNSKTGLIAFFLSRREATEVLSRAFSENLDPPAWIQNSNSAQMDSDPVILLLSPKN